MPKSSKRKTPLCPDPSNPQKEGICPANLSEKNADTYSFVAAGVWFSLKCGAAIPFPPPPAPTPTPVPRFKPRGTLESRQSDSCPNYGDDFVIDDQSNIGDYVHFGDSYGAGMGTGTTSTDKCRVGSENFGKLIYASLGDSDINYEQKVCSGDTLTGVGKQIANWTNYETATIGTLSVGGNDIGFSDLVWNCVITPNTARLGSTNRKNCVASENKARTYLNDQSENGLRYRLSQTYLSILAKAEQGKVSFMPPDHRYEP